MRTLSKTAKIALVAGVAAAGLGTAGAVVMDRREDRAKEARHAEAMAAARLSLAQAIRAAQAAAPGAEVAEAKFKAGKGGPRYEVELVRGQEEVKLSIDPATGAVTGQRVKPLGAGEEDEEDAAAVRGVRPSLLEAVAAAEAKGGRVLEAEVEMEAGRPVIALKVADKAGQVTETRQPATRAAARPATPAPAAAAAEAPTAPAR